MTTITTRAGKGSPLTSGEVDSNFTSLNTDKQEVLSEGSFANGDKTKLDGIADSATANPNAIDGVTIQEEGSSLSTVATTLNFVGSGVTATGTGATKTITVSGGGGSAITVEDEGSALSTAATTLNFTGAGVTASGTGGTKTINVPTSGQVLLSSGTVSNVSSIDFDSSILTGYESYRFVLSNVTPTVDNKELRMRVGTSNTALTTSIYSQSIFQYGRRNDTDFSTAVRGFNFTFFYITTTANTMGTGAGENLYVEVYLPNFNSTTGMKHVVVRTSNYNYIPAAVGQRISALVARTQDALNFVTFFPESDNINTATFRLYGHS